MGSLEGPMLATDAQEDHPMPRMQHRVTLSGADRTTLRAWIDDPHLTPRARKRAQALLLTDRNGPGWPDTQVATATGLSVRTICRVRLDWGGRGLAAIQPRGIPTGRPKLDSEQTARLLALCQSAPPTGQTHWTLRQLASAAVELAIVERLSHETVRRTLKKTACRCA